MQGIQYYACILFMRFYVYICVDLVKRCVHTHVGEIRRYRNDRYYYYYYHHYDDNDDDGDDDDGQSTDRMVMQVQSRLVGK